MGLAIRIGAICLLLPWLSYGQEEEKNWTLNGYAKHLQSVFDIDGIDGYFVDNLVHNRLNFSWFLSDQVTFVAQARNRIFYGDLVRLSPAYASQVEAANNDYLDMSVHLVDKPDWVVNSTMDRLYLEYTQGNLEGRLGRQRINWGISTLWNPNDVFNAFAFTDFDYEERPGSDALRVKYYTGVASSVEFAANAARSWSSRVIATLLKFNTRNYDLQVLTGVAHREVVLGAGWAGNLKNAGFKGEWSLFVPLESGLDKSLALTLAIDQSFAGNLYLSLGYLYNSNGTTDGSLAELFSFELSAKNLYPFRHAIAISGNYPITPLISSGLTFIYSPVSSHPLFVNPTLGISIAQSWDLNLVGQLAYSDTQGRYGSAVTAAFLRLKFSF